MEAITIGASKPKNHSPLRAAIWSAKIAAVVVAAVAVRPYLLLLHSSPRALWLALNLIIVAIWKLSCTTTTAADERHDHPDTEDDVDRPSDSQPSNKTCDHITAAAPTTIATTSTRMQESRNASSTDIEEADEEEEEEEDKSMEDMWRVIMVRRKGSTDMAATANKRALPKSETWERRRERRLERGEVVAQRELRKSTTYTYGEDEEQVGWRRRDVLVVGRDEMLRRRAEAFIQKQHDSLRLQRQESERRKILEKSRRNGGFAAT